MLLARSEIADRVSGRLDTAYATAKDLVRTHEPSLRQVAKAVFVCSTLEGPELGSLLASLQANLGGNPDGARFWPDAEKLIDAHRTD